MSWRVILRLAWMIAGARALNRARETARGGGPTRRLPSRGLARRFADVLRDARIAGQAFTLLVYGAAGAALITAGTSTALLTPRWLGVVLLALGAVAVVAAILEARRLRQSVIRRRLQRRDEALRREL